jgi:glycosyltransferase involved in cell wall biosynthesis
MSLKHELNVAVLVPCFNEELTINTVVTEFKSIPLVSKVYVADNNSTDRTASIAVESGSEVIFEEQQGKGYALRRLFADVEADFYVMVDGDGTYESNALEKMIELTYKHRVDMLIGTRCNSETETGSNAPYRRGHVFGNKVLTGMFRRLFKLDIEDTLSGYRVLSRRFVKSFAADSSGFEVETDLNVHAALVGARVMQIDTVYGARPEGSQSKLNTFSDGLRVVKRIINLFKDLKPVLAFSILATPWLIFSVLLALPPILGYLETGLVDRFPSLFTAVGAFLVSLNLFVAGLILARVTKSRREMLRASYLSVPYSDVS